LRKKTSAVGAVLILAALFLYFSTSVTLPMVALLGPSGTDTVFDKNIVIPIAPQNYSFYDANLTNGDTLAVSLTTHPGNIDVLLMNQGNFSLWSSGAKVSYPTYSESSLNVSSYSFSFTNAEKTQTFYVVLVSHTPSESTEVLLQAIATRPSQSALLLFPALFGLAGVVVLGVGLRGGGAKGVEKAKPQGPAARPAEAAQPKPRSEFCRHCGAALKAGSDFCPSCNKSQL